MRVLYLILYVIGALCFLVAAFFTASVADGTVTTGPPRPVARINLVAAGLFAVSLVWVIQQIDALD